MDVPESMRAELARWNGGSGIDLASWTGCTGNFRLAVGYSTVFWPSFELRGDRVLVAGYPDHVIEGFESQPGATPQSIESTINHLHLEDLQHVGCDDLSADKLVFLGRVLREVYEAKLRWQFPDRPCIVHLNIPNDPDDFQDYILTFWQAKHGDGEGSQAVHWS